MTTRQYFRVPSDFGIPTFITCGHAVSLFLLEGHLAKAFGIIVPNLIVAAGEPHCSMSHEMNKLKLQRTAHSGPNMPASATA